MRDVQTSKEVWHIFISRLNLLLVMLSMLIIIFIIAIVTVAYTPILDLIPGYPGNKSRTALIENIMRLDSLEIQIKKWEAYHDNLDNILQGKITKDTSASQSANKNNAAVTKARPVLRSAADTMFRLEMNADSILILRKESRLKTERSFEMMQPVRGQLKEIFAPDQGMYGVQLIAAPKTAIMSVMDGTVISMPWSAQTGYVVTVQHVGNMNSVYSGVQEPLVKPGQRVKSGQALGITPMANGAELPVVDFQLWYDGNAVDPENYITF